MFSLPAHNRVFVFNAVNPRICCQSARRFNRKDDKLDISLIEAAKNLTEMSLKEVSIHELKSPYFNKKETQPSKMKTFSDISNFALTSLKKCAKVKTVCIGKSSKLFEKNGDKLTSNLAKSLAHSILFTARPTSSNIPIQIRNFKTDRDIHSENARNPTIVSRMRKLLGLEKNLTLLKDNKIVIGPVEQEKIAFAEGFVAGQRTQSVSNTVKPRNLIQQIFSIAINICIIFALIALITGTTFQIQLGNKSEVYPENINATFKDVKGVEEAIQELKDVVEFLKNPEKFTSLGGKLPKGVLLVGPPGTGKTLLARAVAGEAGVPFFHAVGAEFDELYVGQGARRVRELFKAAKERAPCIIFIDEIDSVGAKRTNSGLYPYANQTINQLLSEMDGFHLNNGVIVLGATNRKEDLDEALLRPGRFDVEVNVHPPDFSGRKDILNLYLDRVKAKNINVEMLARGTTGFTGADLENMINQAALRAVLEGSKVVTMKHLEVARDKVLMGPERKSRILDKETNEITAYHEAGHTVVAYFTKHSHPLHKVTIIPRGQSLGHTAYIPEKERYHVTKAQLLAMMDTMMGGRAAEELVFGPDKITSGASSDLKQATSIATHMVKKWGMSEKAGLRTHDMDNQRLINDVSSQTTAVLDSEIHKILQESYERAMGILKTHEKEHKMLAECLMKHDTLDAEDIKAIMTGTVDADKKPNTRPTKEPTTEPPSSAL